MLSFSSTVVESNVLDNDAAVSDAFQSECILSTRLWTPSSPRAKSDETRSSKNSAGLMKDGIGIPIESR